MKKPHKICSAAGWKIDIIQSFEEIETIRPVWEEMQHKQSSPPPNPNADIDRYLSVLEPIKDRVQPFIMLLRRNGYPEAMLIGRKGSTHIRCKIGYLTLLKPSLRCISIAYRGFLGQMKPEVCSILIEELNHSLRNGEADVVGFNHLSTDSEMYQLARIKPNVLSRGYFPKVDPHWRMSVPQDIDLFYKGLSQRHRSNLKRYTKNLEKKHQVRMVTYSRENMLEEVITTAAQISSRTYQYALNSGFVDDNSMRSRLTTAAKHGWLRFHILFINDKPCAFQLGLQYQRTYFLSQIGFDPEWKQWRIGTTLFLKVLEDLCSDPVVDSLDFGFGDAEHKRSYGNEHWLEATVYIFAPRFYPMLVNSLYSSMTGLSLGISSLARKIGFERWAKRRWRNLLQRSNPNSKV